MPHGVANAGGRLEFVRRENRFFEALFQGLRIVRPEEQSATRFYNVRAAAAVGNHGGQSQRQRLHQSDRTRLVGGGKHEQVALQKFGDDVNGRAAKAHLVVQFALANLPAKRGGKGAGL